MFVPGLIPGSVPYFRVFIPVPGPSSGFSNIIPGPRSVPGQFPDFSFDVPSQFPALVPVPCFSLTIPGPGQVPVPAFSLCQEIPTPQTQSSEKSGKYPWNFITK